MSLERFILDVLREFDVVHKKQLTKKCDEIEVDMKNKKIYLKKNGPPGFGKDLYFLYACADIYYRYYNRKDVLNSDKIDLAKRWYSHIYKDLEMLTDDEEKK